MYQTGRKRYLMWENSNRVINVQSKSKQEREREIKNDKKKKKKNDRHEQTNSRRLQSSAIERATQKT